MSYAWRMAGRSTLGQGGIVVFPPHPEGKFATPRDNPFANIDTLVNRGSFGLVVGAQLDSLRRIREDKEFAKAAKADDAKVPEHLWNQRLAPLCPERNPTEEGGGRCIRGPTFSDPGMEKRILSWYRRRIWAHFMRRLLKDCAAHLA